MREFRAECDDGRKLRAWLYPEDPADDEIDPRAFRPHGWRIVIERLDAEDEEAIIRSTWEQHIEEALAHMAIHWPGKPVWRDHNTGEIVEL